MNIYTEEPEDSLVVDEESLDLLLAEVVDEFTNRLQRGESAGIIADELCRQHPELAPAIQDLVPTLAGLATIGRDERGRLQSSNELDEPQADRELGGYRLIRQIGQGGMGVVYEAEDLSLNRMVALKVLRGQAALDSRCLQRFKVEAQAASCLSHPHIVAIYAIGRSDDISYYTMPLIDGLSLDRVIQMLQARSGTEAEQRAAPADVALHSGLVQDLLNGDFKSTKQPSDHIPNPSGSKSATSSISTPPATVQTIGKTSYIHCVAALGIQVADALHHAHETGILHRDIKPGNLLLDRRGNLWITDFGLARLPDSSYAMTDTGERPGTLRYMSPEQAAGDSARVDRRTDLYALGASLYELLTLEPAVRGSDPQVILREIFERDPVPCRLFNPAIPHDLSNIISKCLSKDPAHRYDTGRELAQDLRRFLAGEPVEARPLQWPSRLLAWSRRKPTIAALAALLLGSVIAGFAGVTMAWRAAVSERDEKDIAQRASSHALEHARISHLKSVMALNEVDAFSQFLRNHFLMTQAPFSHEFDNKLTLKQALLQAAESIEPTFQNSPKQMTLVDKDFAQAFHDQGLYERSSFHINRALKTVEMQANAPPDPSYLILPGGLSSLPGAVVPPMLSDTRLSLEIMRGHSLYHLGLLTESEIQLRQILEELDVLKEPESLRRVMCEKYLSETLMGLGNWEEAERIQRPLLDRIPRVEELPTPSLNSMEADVTLRLADIEFERGDHVQAIERVRKLETKLLSATPVPIEMLLNCRNNLGSDLQRDGQLEKAEEIFRELVKTSLQIHGESDFRTLLVQENLAKVLLHQHQKLDEAEFIIRGVLSKLMVEPGPDDALTLKTQFLLAQLIFENGRIRESVELTERILERQRDSLGAMHPDTKATADVLERIRNMPDDQINK